MINIINIIVIVLISIIITTIMNIAKCLTPIKNTQVISDFLEVNIENAVVGMLSIPA